MTIPISPTPIVEVEYSQRQSQVLPIFFNHQYASRIFMKSIGLYKMCNARMMFLSHSVIRNSLWVDSVTNYL